ncbi:MAG TPA: hypothetical protein VE486_02295, partial [Candidatus Baltobacteraceae bacterium]|nr:hypothetical protein [Candidatus Baltobacteraceae bacterium]
MNSTNSEDESGGDLNNRDRDHGSRIQRVNSWIVTNLWMIPAAPIAISLVILSLAKSRRKSAAALAVTGQLMALTFSIFAFLPTLQTAGFRVVENFTWFTFGETALRIGWVLDPLA